MQGSNGRKHGGQFCSPDKGRILKMGGEMYSLSIVFTMDTLLEVAESSILVTSW